MTICYPDTTDWGCYGTAEEIDQIPADVKARAEGLAWYTLAALCAYRIGVCPTTIRPCAARCATHGSWTAAPVTGAHVSALPLQTIGGIFTPYVTSGQWVNSGGCSGPSDCSCSSLSEVILPGPVGGIESITVDGAVIPADAYRVDNGDRLVRLDGGTWPVCQDMAKSGPPIYEPVSFEGPGGSVVFMREGQTITVYLSPSGDATLITGGNTPWPAEGIIVVDHPGVGGDRFMVDTVGAFNLISAADTDAWTFTYETSAAPDAGDREGVFEVTYYRGAAPNELTNYAAGVLASEFAKACLNKKCRLPRGVTSVVRAGTTMEFRSDIWEGGLTTIPEVDTVINIYNPNHLKQAPRVLSPEQRRRGRARTTTWGVR